MFSRVFVTVCVILLFIFTCPAAFAYTGQGQFSIPIGQPAIDGVINPGEWGTATWIDMDTVYSGTPTDVSQARWAAMWSPATNLVYVVITGTDTDHIFSSDFTVWNAHDDVEIHIDAGNTNTSDPAYYSSTVMRYAQHYFIGYNGTGGAWSHISSQSADSAIPGGYAVTVNGDVITYEFALTPYTDLNLANPAGSPVRTLQPGDVIGLDMVMFTRQTSGTTGMLCENAVTGKFKDASTFLDHTLVGLRLAAYDESPADDSTQVSTLPVLAWTPGIYAAGHDVYFGTGFDDVNDANNSDLTGIYRGLQALDANSYDTADYDPAGLLPGRTYFWRVDEVNDACQPQPWKGPVWGLAVRCDMSVEGRLDIGDLKAFTLQWLAEGSLMVPTTWCCGADMDHNGGVDFTDYSLFADQWAIEAAQQGNTFYVDPVSGSMANDGSYYHPWSTLQAVFAANKIESRDKNLNPRNTGAPVKAGDTIMLRSGNHGIINETGGYHNTSTITIEAQSGHTPKLKSWAFDYASNWVIRGLEFAYGMGGGHIIDILSGSSGIATHDITIEDCYIYTQENTTGWTTTEWNNVPYGVYLYGSGNVILQDCTIKNIDMGVVATSNTQVIGCTIRNFAKDGIRGAGSNITLEENEILDSYNVNTNHDDGIQWYSGP
ncbi:MAG TPA: sugar-binding protein, partial [Sedimentisphaerales bacterium]|nr:sugar-binding protein [Sedimentisphaerales bacterium]